MKRFLLVVLIGFVAGAAAHIGFYAFRRPTVESHLARVYAKLGVRSRTQLIGRLMADLAGPASR